MGRAIDGDELLGIERLLDTDVVRQSKTASWLLDQVLHDIQAMPTLKAPNEPLTLDELREMDGEPVWCMELKSWALIYTNDGAWEPQLILPDPDPVINFPVKKHNRTYTLYRRPPGGEEDV